MALRLNCDLGESFGAWTMGMDDAVMPHIDQANIACGFHGGDPLVMERTLQLAKQHKVAIGAHPGYPDLAGFGRRSMTLSAAEIRAMLTYQVAALDGMALTQAMTLEYVKPHGALYNDMMKDDAIRHTIMDAVAAYHRPLKLMLQATTDSENHLQEAESRGIELLFEAFADRCYDDDGSLLSRNKPGAVHNREAMLKQVQQLKTESTVTTISGHTLSLKVDTLCLHGDNMEGVQAIETIKQLVSA